MRKYDERETLFSRISLKKNSPEYKKFYHDKKELRKKDDAFRKVSFRQEIRKSNRFKELFLPLPKANKALINSVFHTARDLEVNPNRIDIPKSFSENIKEITKYYGATDVGIVKLNDYHYYSHSGGVAQNVGIDDYNKVIVPRYKTAIIFTMLMDKDQINRAPHFEELLATENAYLKCAFTASRLEMYIKELGYKAEGVNSEYYLGPLVPLAHDAGLGEIGMCNHLVTKEYGDNVRLGAVYTTMELTPDEPKEYGLKEFCKKCALCLMNCPSKAISHLPREVNGRQFYKFDDNKCFNVWVNSGTDCGTCIQSCPFTQGVDLDKVDKMMEQPELMDEIMKEHFDKFGRRNYTKGDLKIVSIEDEES